MHLTNIYFTTKYYKKSTSLYHTMHSCGSVGSYKALHKACPIPKKYVTSQSIIVKNIKFT